MTRRPMRWISRVVIGHPGLVTALVLLLTVFLYAHIRYLRLGTDLTDLFGGDDPQWKAVSQLGRELGYGNQLFVLVEGRKGSDEDTDQIEEMADRLTSDMEKSGLFKYARSGLKEEELLNMVKLFAWNFPFFLQPDQWEAAKHKLDPREIRRTVGAAGSELVTPFSAMGTQYFVDDPLGLMEVVAARGGRGLSQFGNFDLTWGSGNRFFSQDHKALLIIAEPRLPAVDYQFAQRVVQWTRQRIAAIGAEQGFRDSGVRVTPAGAYVYAEEDHRFIEENIRRISLISIVGNLLLCLAIYPRIPLLLLSLLPASLGILWTTGVASFYPGEVNLISLSFIAILAGLGDDQVVHFFNRVPQEWAKTGSLDKALTSTYETTGLSIVFCILTAATATAALATSSFKALAEFGFILTVGMVMMMLHTLFTVPALMRLWWRFSKPKAPETITFRFLPWVARHTVDFVGRYPRGIAAVSLCAFAVSLFSMSAVKMNRKFEVARADNPAMAAQNRLSARFGIEGSPDVLLMSGGQEEVLRRAEELTAALEDYQRRGIVKTVFSPASVIPSRYTQTLRARPLAAVDLKATARALEEALRARGFRTEPFEPFLNRLRELAQKPEPLSVEQAAAFLPQGLLDNSIRKTGNGAYVAVVAFYSKDPDATQVVPDSVLASWRRQFGPFSEFSFNKINRDVQDRVLQDSRRALFWTAGGIMLIVYLCFRNIRISLLVLLPIAFGISVTFGLLLLAGHRFSFMAITAIPLIIGIGIDNGIHLVRRYLESDKDSILDVAKASGAALIQSNLTTIMGFGALMASSFAPLAEMGLVTVLGVTLALAGGLVVIPALLVVWPQK